MKKITTLLLGFTCLFAQAGTYQYETVPGDPFGAKIYTLKNGLKVYLSENHETPRVQTLIAVKAGSKFDPPQTTGLAHYLEHMLFKGSHHYGTADWETESRLLKAISDLFEQHLNEKDEAKKKAIYARIDSLSYEASKYAIPNEYDKMTTSIGAQGTNAFTAEDMTVYVNEIPSNGIEKFFRIESERFPNLVLRLFHTELETVYEEFNRNQDNDRRWSIERVVNALLPNHPYGTQTTIGEGEHLKNPSMVNIHNYHRTYYVPNNMAIIMAGDINPDETVALIEKYFGNWQPGALPAFEKKAPVILTSPVIREYSGPQPEHLQIGFRFDGANTREAMMARLVDNILANGEAGLIDLDLVQQQKVLNAYSYLDEMNDYSIHFLYGEPKQGQSLEEVKNLLLAEIEKVKKGDFPDWLLPAIIQNEKLKRMKQLENNRDRAGMMMGAFVFNKNWMDVVNEIDEMSKIVKSDIMRFAAKHYGENYAVCFKRLGEPNVHKVEKPKITAVVMNKDRDSKFKQQVDAMPMASIQPRFLDFNKDILHSKLSGSGISFSYIPNIINKTFSLNYIFDLGTDNIRELGLAIGYLEYLGTDKYTAEQLKSEFYKLGLSFSVNSSRDRCYVTLSGLDDNFEAGLMLFEELLREVKPDDAVYSSMVDDLLQKRINAKKNKGTILYSALGNYAKYGAKNPFNDIMSETELRKINPEELTKLLRSLSGYEHRIFYYGSRKADDVQHLIGKHHRAKLPLTPTARANKYREQPITENRIYFCDYNMKQAEVLMLSSDVSFDASLFPFVYLYNDYYGSGLSSIMFQEIREKMALAYAVNSRFSVPDYKGELHYVQSYVGTQSDKLKTALTEMKRLLNDMPEVNGQFEGARNSVITTLESDWTTREGIYWAFDRAQKRGLNSDVRKDVYEKAKTMKVKDLTSFFNTHVKGKPMNYLVIGKKENLNLKDLESFGTVKQLSLEELFGY